MRARFAVKEALGVFVLSLLGAAVSAGFDEGETAAIFDAAGFKQKEGRYVRCEDDPTLSYQPGWIEAADLNGDGEPEAWVRESSGYCYGNTAEYFVLLTRDSEGGWIRLLEGVGMALEREEHHAGWPDIEVGGPGPGPFPIYAFDGGAYVPK